MSVEILENRILSDNWYVLRKYTYRHRLRNGEWRIEHREAYDRGNGAAILLHDPRRGTVVLTRQFRLPTFVNGNPDGLLIEVCAGLLDADDPETCIRREAEEETGYVVEAPRKVFELYMSPGSVTESVHFFVAEYDPDRRRGIGGGLPDEEDIEVLELPLEEAWAMVKDGRIRDGKTVILLQYAWMNGGIDRGKIGQTKG